VSQIEGTKEVNDSDQVSYFYVVTVACIELIKQTIFGFQCFHMNQLTKYLFDYKVPLLLKHLNS